MNFKEVAQKWGISISEDGDVAAFLEDLANKIEVLWNEDPEKLLNTLYRLDVSEAKLEVAMKRPKSGSMSRDVAELIVERELQKFKTRNSK
jgi:hypothetical protein